MALTMHPSLAVHPGPWLKAEMIDPHKVRIGELAERFGVSRQALSNLLKGRAALTADMAIRFEKAFGIRADTMMRMQVAFDLAKAREHEDKLHVERLVAA
jgi:addiction module HigA family antidote